MNSALGSYLTSLSTPPTKSLQDLTVSFFRACFIRQILPRNRPRIAGSMNISSFISDTENLLTIYSV